MLHFRVSDPRRRMNDPNGPCYWKGRYHLFFQHRDVQGELWIWGHAVSADLARWEQLEDAILPKRYSKPGEKGYSGAESCWSGAICVDNDRVIAAFYGHGEDSGIYLMTASDEMLCEWKCVGTGPAIPSALQPDQMGPFVVVPYAIPPVLYDPFIWVKEGTYYILSGGVICDKHTGGIRRQSYLYSSVDLVHWTYCNPLISDNSFGSIFDDGACPYFYPWNDGKTEGEEHRILLHFSHQHSSRYIMGVYDEKSKTFEPYNGDKIEGISQCDGYYAPALFEGTPDGSMLAVYLMNSRGGQPVMSMIHRLERCGEFLEELSVSPAVDVDTLPYTCQPRHGEESCIRIIGETVVLKLSIKYQSTEGVAPTLYFHRADGTVFGNLRLHLGCGGRRKTRNALINNDLVVLTLEDRPDPAPPKIVRIPPTNGLWEMTLVVDGDTMEIFYPNALSMGRRMYGDLSRIYLSLEGGCFKE